ncbi:TetR/AcrR family transcriptional regulator, partial [Streptomyces griseoruber]
RPIVECNRVQIDNGRTYLREMVFGDPEEPRHAAALAIVAQTEEAVAAVMFLSMATSVNIALSVEEIVQDIRKHVDVLLPR